MTNKRTNMTKIKSNLEFRNGKTKENIHIPLTCALSVHAVQCLSLMLSNTIHYPRTAPVETPIVPYSIVVVVVKCVSR